MTRARRRLADGELRVTARDDALAQAALDWAAALAPHAPRVAAPLALGAEDAWAKAEALPGKAAWRHGARATWLRAPLPREREYANLAWLRARLFDAPAPLAAGAWWRGGFPRWQFLLARRVPDATPLDEAVARGAADVDALLDELADEVARLHALRCVHRDLWLRNLLVRAATPGARRLVWIDLWRGGARPQLRGAPHDLACLTLDLAARGAEARVEPWLDRYVAGRAAQGRAVDARALRRAIERERAALRRRWARRGRAHELAPPR